MDERPFNLREMIRARPHAWCKGDGNSMLPAFSSIENICGRTVGRNPSDQFVDSVGDRIHGKCPAPSIALRTRQKHQPEGDSAKNHWSMLISFRHFLAPICKV